MPQDFQFVGPPDPPAEQQGPPAPPELTAFQKLARAGSMSEGIQPSHVFRPFVGMIPNRQAAARKKQALMPVADAQMTLLDQLISDGMSIDRARAVSGLQTARRLKQLGFTAEAQAMYKTSLDAFNTDTDTTLARDKMTVDIENTLSTIDQRGDTTLIDVQEERSLLEAEFETGTADGSMSDVEGRDVQRKLGELDSWIDKHLTTTGRTEADLLSDPSFTRKQMGEHFEDNLLLARLDVATQMLGAVTSEDVALLARGEAAFVGFMQGTFGFDPTESQQQNIDNIVNQRGSVSLVAAKIRHALTGAQMSQFEIQYLEPFLPAPGDSLGRQQAKLRLIRRFIMSDINTRMNLMFDPNFSKAAMDIDRETEILSTDSVVDAARKALE